MSDDTAERAASLLLDAVGNAVPPIPVEEIALRLGIEAIRKVPLLEDGRLEIIGGVATILVNTDTGRQRQRFTVAHELAHWLLADREQEFIAYRARPASPFAVERFCDEFAAALLLPTDWVRSQSCSADSSLQIMRRVARISDTSLTATFRRLRHIAHWKESLLMLQIGSHGWALQRVLAATNYGGSVRAGTGFSGAVARSYRLGSASMRLPLVLNGLQVRPRAEVLFDDSRNALATVDLYLNPRPFKRPRQLNLF